MALFLCLFWQTGCRMSNLRGRIQSGLFIGFFWICGNGNGRISLYVLVLAKKGILHRHNINDYPIQSKAMRKNQTLRTAPSAVLPSANLVIHSLIAATATGGPPRVPSFKSEGTASSLNSTLDSAAFTNPTVVPMMTGGWTPDFTSRQT